MAGDRPGDQGMRGMTSDTAGGAVDGAADGGLETCAECGSAYRRAASRMAALCPECAHRLYGTDNCPHQFVDGRCARCHWDGSVSAYVRSLGQSDGA